MEKNYLKNRHKINFLQYQSVIFQLLYNTTMGHFYYEKKSKRSHLCINLLLQHINELHRINWTHTFSIIKNNNNNKTHELKEGTNSRTLRHFHFSILICGCVLKYQRMHHTKEKKLVIHKNRISNTSETTL